MAWHNAVYAALLLVTVSAAMRYGGTPERMIAAVWLANNVGSAWLLAPSNRYDHLGWWVWAIDLATFAAMLAVVWRTRRYWPVVAAGMQLGGVAAHLVRLLQPEMARFGYAFGQSIWAYPILIALLLGVIRHRSRLRLYSRDP